LSVCGAGEMLDPRPVLGASELRGGRKFSWTWRKFNWITQILRDGWPTIDLA
jgi:hypothetical protein